jgi:hypothetical protein
MTTREVIGVCERTTFRRPSPSGRMSVTLAD